MISKISFLLIGLALLIWSFACGYWLGCSHQKIKYSHEEIESVKKITQKKAIIYSRPNINRDVALELMRQNKL